MFYALLFALSSASAEEPQWKQLHASSATATSFLQNNWNKYSENYHPNYALDDNARTAWVEGDEGDGVGAVLAFRVSKLSSARSVKIGFQNGYQKSEKLFKANAAIKDVEIRLISPSGETVATETRTLPRAMGWHDEVVSIPGEKGFWQLELKILSVHPGSVYKDTCLSDVALFVDSDVTYNAEVEGNKHQMLKKWIDERQQTAKYFAAKPATYPFANTTFQYHRDDLTVKDFASPKVEIDAMRASGTWYQGVVSKPIQALPDGLEMLEPFKDLLVLGEVSFFESAKELGKHTTQGEEWGAYEVWRSNYQIQRDESGTIRRVYFWKKEIHEERSTYKYENHYVLEYRPDGKLVTVLKSGVSDDMETTGVHESRLRFDYDDAGKINKVVWLTFDKSTWLPGFYGGEEPPEPRVQVMRLTYAP